MLLTVLPTRTSSANTLRVRLGVGAARARRLVKAVREEYEAEVARHPVDAYAKGGDARCPDNLEGGVSGEHS